MEKFCVILGVNFKLTPKTMRIKRNIVFGLEKRKKKGVMCTENLPIRMRVNYDGKRIDFYSGYRIDESKWDAGKQRVKNGCTNKLQESASDINAELLRGYSIIQDIFKEYELQEVIPTPDMLRNAFHAKVTGDESKKNLMKKSFFDVYSEFCEENGKLNNWTVATRQKFEAQRHHLQDFNPNITFSDFTEEGINKYISFLGEELKMRNSTIGKQLGFLKWFLRWSLRKRYHENDAFESYKPKLKNPGRPVIFLTRQEQEQLKNYMIPPNKQYLERVRDVFFFCCFTGLRYSDAYNLRRSDIKDNHLDLVTIKTNDHLTIELNKHSRAILEKYKDIPFQNDKALPVISNQRMNEYLKELCELAGIDAPVHLTYYRGQQRVDETLPKYELIGTHAGRRTFICNAILLGIPANVIMKWTGHSDYKAMKPYIDIADETKAQAMERFDNL